MNFELTNEQEVLRGAAEKFIADEYDFAARQEIAAGEKGYSDKHWGAFRDLGWLSLGFEEAHGGFDDAAVETMLLANAFGKGLVVEPFYSTVVLGGSLLTGAASAEQKAALIPDIIEGKTKLAFAYAEPDRRYDFADIETIAAREKGGYSLHGRKSVVFDAPHANYLIVTAYLEGAHGLRLFLAPNDAKGVSRRDYRTTDGRRASEIEFQSVRLDETSLLDASNGDAAPVIEAAADRATAVACADAVGAMEHLFQTTLEYLKTRKQFGTTIGSFQAIQHRMTELFVQLELAKSMSIYANLSLQSPPEERKKAVSQAKIEVIAAAQLIGRQAIQLHGGIGMTNEFHVGHFFKRLTAFESYLGDASHHASRIESLEAA